MAAYYNEIDPYAAQWLRNLITAGHIAPGDVDDRDIRDIHPDDLKHYTQCHFFAGIGIWSYALRQSGWDDSRPVWTGSCPCQPFSMAGQGEGFTDERHLWPAWHHLITQQKPDVIFGEQVASKAGLGWLDLVQTDLENTAYACGAVDLCAAGVGAPHIRQRLWFVAERLADHSGSQCARQMQESRNQSGISCERESIGGCCNAGGVGDSSNTGLSEQQCKHGISRETNAPASRETLERASSSTSGLAHADSSGPQQGRQATPSAGYRGAPESASGTDRYGPTGPTNGFWRDVDWLSCRDGKWRPVRPGSFPLAHGATARVGRLRAYGNAINAEVAKTFISSYIETAR